VSGSSGEAESEGGGWSVGGKMGYPSCKFASVFIYG